MGKGRCICGGELQPLGKEKDKHSCSACGKIWVCSDRPQSLTLLVGISVGPIIDKHGGENKSLTTRQLAELLLQEHGDELRARMTRPIAESGEERQIDSIMGAIHNAWRVGIGKFGEIPPQKTRWARTEHPKALTHAQWVEQKDK